MSQKLLVTFVLGCLTGGVVVRLTSADHEPAASAPIIAKDSEPGSAPLQRAVPMQEYSPVTKVEARSPATSSSPAAAPAALQAADAAAPTPYNFGELTRSEQRLDDIFRAERVDQAWASQTVDSLNLVLSAMPERSVIGDYGLTCKESLCKLELRGDPKVLASNDPKNNVQPALMRMMAEPPASEMFDDSMMNVSFEDNDGLVKITVFAHRRTLKH